MDIDNGWMNDYLFGYPNDFKWLQLCRPEHNSKYTKKNLKMSELKVLMVSPTASQQEAEGHSFTLPHILPAVWFDLFQQKFSEL